MTTDNKAGHADNLDDELEALPEKFKGKNVVDVAKAYQELETAYSRQGSELGEYRRLATTLASAGSRASDEAPKERTEVTTEAFLENPSKTLDEAIESHPVVQKARETADLLEKQLAVREFESKHPEYKEDVSDPEFSNWVKKNPFLTKLAAQADSYDMGAADQLWSLWEEKKSLQKEASGRKSTDENKKRKEREGTLEGASGADSSTEQTYSRAEIVELKRRSLLGDKSAIAKVNDPKYKKAIYKAYVDKRVS